jgi:cytochrome c6
MRAFMLSLLSVMARSLQISPHGVNSAGSDGGRLAARRLLSDRVRVRLLVVVPLALAAGCGGGDGGGDKSDSAGAKVFAESGCGTCHTYGPAGSAGDVGPNLDDANVTFERAVEQVTNGGGGMPAYGDPSDPEHARLLSKEEIEEVARFVSQGG